MPWSNPNPITGACEYCPTTRELIEEALNSYACLLVNDYERSRKPCFTFAELAEEIRKTYETRGEDIGARRNRLFVETLEQHPNWKFRNPNIRK